jgi:tRNA dimethylallyltransferase
MDALVIAGPTAAGKTALALEVAQYIPSEIINMDSALVYRGMDIGTAKPTLFERQDVPHHLIDIIAPEESYSAADFVRDVEVLIPQIQARGKLPIVVGGTMLYLHSWVNGLSDLPSADDAIRARLQAEWQQDPLAMHQRLCDLDALAGKRIHPNDPQRILRALEVIEITGLTLTEQHQQRSATQLKLKTVFIMPPTKEWLHQRMGQRFELMLAHGLLDEVRILMRNPKLTALLPSMRSVGYRQAWQYLQGEINEQQLHEQALSATRSLAKRQLTWMKKMASDLILDANLSLSDQLSQLMTLLSDDKMR